MTGLTATELAIVREILERLLPGRDVVAFGSRARGGHKPMSDLDLAVLGDSPMSLSERATVEEAFSESDLPMKVDLVDWATADASFRRLVERDAMTFRHTGDHRWQKA
ncbi:MAG: nucleotidyltransferase domain-containing protein [Alphaproteobacteria bacterium]|nr:nucleotidyltransferase domain-containing protein [Alphaproteobacteria bacterium]